MTLERKLPAYDAHREFDTDPWTHQFGGGGRLRQLLGVAGDEARVDVAGPEVRRVQDQLMVPDRRWHLQRRDSI